MTHLLAIALILLMQRVERTDGVHVVYYLETAEQPRIAVTSGRVSGVTSVQDDTTGAWRTTVAARLDACAGVLTADGVEVARQRCVWLPEAAKE